MDCEKLPEERRNELKVIKYLQNFFTNLVVPLLVFLSVNKYYLKLSFSLAFKFELDQS